MSPTNVAVDDSYQLDSIYTTRRLLTARTLWADALSALDSSSCYRWCCTGRQTRLAFRGSLSPFLARFCKFLINNYHKFHVPRVSWQFCYRIMHQPQKLRNFKKINLRLSEVYEIKIELEVLALEWDMLTYKILRLEYYAAMRSIIIWIFTFCFFMRRET